MDSRHANHVGANEAFDRRKFLASVDGNLEPLREVAQLFLEDYPRRLAAIRDALARRDCAALENAAHMLKGSAGYICADSVFDAAVEVETIARSGDLARAGRACTKLQQETGRLARALATVG